MYHNILTFTFSYHAQVDMTSFKIGHQFESCTCDERTYLCIEAFLDGVRICANCISCLIIIHSFILLKCSKLIFLMILNIISMLCCVLFNICLFNWLHNILVHIILGELSNKNIILLLFLLSFLLLVNCFKFSTKALYIRKTLGENRTHVLSRVCTQLNPVSYVLY